MVPFELPFTTDHPVQPPHLTAFRTVWFGLHSVCPFEFSLSFICRMVPDYCIFCASLHIVYLFCSAMIQFCTVWFLLFNCFIIDCCLISVKLLFAYYSLFWSWKCIPAISIPKTITRKKKTLPVIIKYSQVNEHRTSTGLAYFHLSIGFSKAYLTYCHHRPLLGFAELFSPTGVNEG
jgi:hypothetical protein